MKLATIRVGGGHAAVRVDTEAAVETGARDVRELLSDPDWRARAENASGAVHNLSTVDYAPVVPEPGKIFCVGLNYRNHILEMGRELPEYPTLFAKFADALIGARDDIRLPAVSEAIDWEAELAVIIGEPVRDADRARAATAIAGYSALNDVTARDYQYRTTEWLQGKTFEATTPFGPVLVTPDELPEDLELTCEVDGEPVQKAGTSDLVFDPPHLVSYLSRIITLRPGDVIATGTPGGVGHARKPPRYLTDGSVVTTRITGIGELVNRARR
ncbi:fumarylacetoacetate hydrolase family protein [Amycolatopsis alkalitolerans]|uniref:Fumarylacetoacetate hydrolase family protein n=1 Tax=Amycolatopsis alkalitolerans TaxID=2547244 RepID=A0A5C4LX12_9PSEU|nr:fumarylacetoacetate hydrolase family protein [Amycolatopsis alkalitolerans]TNC22403.1 fumarylacetoacetate hydrolase family protein [Amycolatopsis alkalitolerans]